MPRFYLGVDGGQSSTVALIADQDGRVLGSGRSGPCNHVNAPEARAKFLAVLGECLRQAARGVLPSSERLQFAAACLGFSGGAEDKLSYTGELLSADFLKVTHDAEIALTGATEGEPGIVSIAGTGSISFGRNAAGRTARAGGWGYIFGDEGGGFDITRRALRAALQLEEGWGPETALREKLLRATGARTANELMHKFYAETPRAEVAALAQLVAEAAEQRDGIAKQILADAAHALAWYVAGVYGSLFASSERVPVAYIGGVFTSATLTGLFREQVAAAIDCPVIAPRSSPAVGALLEAFRLDGNRSRVSSVPGTKT